MEIYLVGGAVRDQLLGLPIKERDWVVVGATVDEMLKLRYRQVGKDFPVFLHPNTNEEYALARKERKTGPGYTGFDFDTSEAVTLEEDLLRRDLTINAIALKPDGTFVDPFHGKQDLEKKLLRHVSSAFVEDPVRILRAARFAARFAEFGFTVAPDTMALMKSMVQSGEVNALVSERVWKELEKALLEKNPEEFFLVLDECHALKVLFPSVTLKQMPVLKKAVSLSEDPEVRFAALTHTLAIDEIKILCDRFRVPNAYRELAQLVSQLYSTYLQANELDAKGLINFLSMADAFRRETRFKKFLLTCEAIAALNSPDNMTARLLQVFEIAKAVDIKKLLSIEKVVGKEIAALVNSKRIEVVDNFIQGFKL